MPLKSLKNLDRLSAELLEASDQKGGANKKKEEVHQWPGQ